MLFAILLVVSTLILSGLSIMDATQDSSAELRESTGAGFTMGTDGQLTDKILDKISLINGVDSIDNAHSESYAEYKSIDGKSLNIKTDEFVMEERKGFEHAGKLQSNI